MKHRFLIRKTAVKGAISVNFTVCKRGTVLLTGVLVVVYTAVDVFPEMRVCQVDLEHHRVANNNQLALLRPRTQVLIVVCKEVL